MADFDQELTAPARKDFLKLLSVRVEVPSDDDIVRLQGDFDYTPAASIVCEWEPVSYRMVDQDNNPVTLRDRVKLTKLAEINGERQGLTTEELEAIRTGFFRAINPNRLYSIPQGKKLSETPFVRWSQKRAAGGFKLSVNDGETDRVPVGQVYSEQEGHVFEVETVRDEFPLPTTDARGRFQWSKEESYEMRMRYPIRVADDYVAGDDVPTIVVERDDTPRAAVTSSGSTSSGPSTEILATAAQAVGLVGRNIKDFQGAGAQVNLIGSNAGVAPVLLSGGPSGAAAEGTLIDYLVGQGAIAVESDGTIVHA